MEGRSVNYAYKMGIGGRILNWIKDFLFDRKIQVQIGSDFSNQYTLGNGTHLLRGTSRYKVGRSLLMYDGALWKRGRNTTHASGK